MYCIERRSEYVQPIDVNFNLGIKCKYGVPLNSRPVGRRKDFKMKKIIGILCLFLLLVGFSQTASAVPTFSNGKNEVYYRNYETVFRDNGSGTYEELDYTDPNNPPEIAVGDIFVGIMSLQNITEQGSTVWSESAGSPEFLHRKLRISQ